MSDSETHAKVESGVSAPTPLKREREDADDVLQPLKSQKSDVSVKVETHDTSSFGAAKDVDDAESESENSSAKGGAAIEQEDPEDSQVEQAEDVEDAPEEAEDAANAEDNEDEEEDEEKEEKDEDEDEEEEEEDEEGDDRVSAKKSKKRRANQFLDIEAEVDDEEEDELDEDDAEAELLREQFISDDQNDREANDPALEDDRFHRQYDRRRQEAEDQDAEVLAETLKHRYRKTHTVYRGDTAATGIVSQKLLMPSINDPAIFAIRCTPGREKEVVRKLYEKKRTLARLGRPLEVLTVFQRDSFKGYIYIEAKKPEAIQQALNGMVKVYPTQRIIVPVSEYPDLLKQVKSTDVEIVPGIYVRITRGKYKGDLAIVDNLSENGLEVRCKLVPRLDYGRNDEVSFDGKKIKLKIRPIPNLFNEQEARTYDPEGFQAGRGLRSYIYRGDEYQDGFLFKDFKLQIIQTKEVHPRLDELDLFQSGSKNGGGMDLANVAATLKNNKSQEGGQSSAFQPGDNVEIRRGEQARTVGRVLGISLNEVTIVVLDAGDKQLVNQELTVTIGDLRKVFALGDHVKVIEGKHTDQTGLVIKLDGDTVVLLSDQTKEDLRVFANYLIKATDSSTSADMVNSMYEIKDLVQLNASTFGVIVKAETGFYGVLTSDGRMVNVKPTGISGKLRLTRREQVATDRFGLTIKVGDLVKEKGGDEKKEGAILHVFKNTLFVESRDLIENLGIFVTSALNVSTVSTKNLMISRNLGADLTRMNPNLKLAPIAAHAGRMRAGGRDKLLNKDVVINSGNHKGLMGKVIETDDVDARIELHTKSKKIKVNKTKLSVLVRGESIPYLRFIGASDTGRASSSLGPAFSSGGRSVLGGATPSISAGAASSWQAKTPSLAAGANSSWGNNENTSAWGSSGAMSTWGSRGSNSTWGPSNTAAGSTWDVKTSGNSAWGRGGDNSTWGKTGDTSAWGNTGGDTSAWGKTGGSSSWGKSGRGSVWGDGQNSAWGSRNAGDNNSAWGGRNNDGNNSAWGARGDGNNSAWGSNKNNNTGADSAWGNQGNNTSGWGNNNSDKRGSWERNDGGSTWGAN